MTEERQVRREEIARLEDGLQAQGQMLSAIFQLNERVTHAVERMVGIDAKLGEVQRSIVEIQKTQAVQQGHIEVLMTSHTGRKAVEGVLSWLIDKAPTLGAIAVFCFWALSNWEDKP